MSISSLRLRRTTLSLCTFIFNHPITPLSTITPPHLTQTPQNPSLIIPNLVSQFRAFRVSNTSLARPRTGFNNNDEDLKFGHDEILFEGCDYNHWLITVDFPKDPKPSPQEMVDTYVKIAAMVFGCPEEAKKKIYACSTTTYEGFQVECSEAMSTKFEGLPGVVFILPDSYVDPVNKEYGGDKYDNGIITPRPPPMQYGRTGGRFGDRNRDFNRPSRPRGEFQQGNPAYDNRGSTQGSAGNFGPPPSPPPQQNYGPPRVAPMNNFPGGQENYQGYGRDQMSPNQGNYNQGQRGNSYPQGPSAPPRGLNNNAASPPQGGNFMQGAVGNYGQGASGSYNQGADVSYGQGAAGSYGQGGAGNYGQGGAGNYGQGGAGNYGQGVAGNYRQGASGYGHGAGNYGQGEGGNFGQGATGSFGQGTGGAVSGQEKFPNYGQPNSVDGENQRFSQGEQMNDLRQVQQ